MSSGKRRRVAGSIATGIHAPHPKGPEHSNTADNAAGAVSMNTPPQPPENGRRIDRSVDPSGAMTTRPLAGQADLAAIADLLAACQAAARADRVLQRFGTALRPGAATRLWVAPDGEVLACALLTLTTAPNLECHVRPKALGTDVETQLMAWVVDQARQIALERGAAVHVGATVDDDEERERTALLARQGFDRRELHGQWMERPLSVPVPPPLLAPGFALRPVEGEHELEAFAALFRKAFGPGQNVEARRRVWRGPDHIPELLAIAPDGTLAAFCYYRIDREQNARLGRAQGTIVQLGTRPAYRRRGLARGLLRAALRDLRARKMVHVILHVASANRAAQVLYESEGFRVTSVTKTTRYVKTIAAG